MFCTGVQDKEAPRHNKIHGLPCIQMTFMIDHEHHNIWLSDAYAQDASFWCRVAVITKMKSSLSKVRLGLMGGLGDDLPDWTRTLIFKILLAVNHRESAKESYNVILERPHRRRVLHNGSLDSPLAKLTRDGRPSFFQTGLRHGISITR